MSSHGVDVKQSRSSKLSRIAAGAALLTLATGALAGASSASASTATLSANQVHRLLAPSPRIHTLPRASRRAQVATAAAATNLTYHGGQVMSTANHAVPIFWEPATLQTGAAATVDPNYNTLVQRYFSDVGGHGLYQVNAQYYEIISGTQHFIVNSANLLQAVVDTSAYPAAGAGCAGNGTNCIDDAQVQAEVTKVINANALPKDKQTMYFVYMAGGESQCADTVDCFRTTGTNGGNFVYCAYHSFFTLGGQNVIYASMPYGALAYLNECTAESAFPNNTAADIVLSTTSHEQMEAVTDPYLDAWYDASGAENGDKCAYNEGTKSFDGGLANEQWNTHFYLLQQEWNNAATACSQGLPVTSASISVNDVSVTEGNAGTKTATITFKLSAAQAGPVSFKFATANGTATAGSDYVAKSLTKTFNAGQTTITSLITINGDTTVEPNETVLVNLTNPVGATISDNQGILTITNDDGASGPTISVSDVSIVEGNAGTKTVAITFHLSAAQATAVSFTWATANGTATAGSDYVAKSLTKTFNAGQITITSTVTINGDTTIEPNETFQVNLTNPVGATFSDNQGIVTISNDD